MRVQRALRQLMLDGALPAGSALPATRTLAQSLGVSRDTVEAAYGQLQLEGFVDRQVGRGSFVCARVQAMRPAPSARRTSATAPPARLSQRGAAIQRGGGVHSALAARPFAQGLPETRNFPLPLWERLQRQVLKEWGSAALASAPPQGMAPLRRAIADYLNLERGARTTPDQVLVLTSAQQALTLCATVLLDAGDGIGLEDPAYHGARRAFEAAGLRCLPVPVDAQGLQTDALRRKTQAAAAPRALYLTPSHQFPTGATLSLARRLALIEWARQQQAWLIEDDYDSEFHYAGRPTACVQGLDAHGRTLYIGTFSKSLFPGLRLAYMALPAALVAPMTAARTVLDGHSAPLAQLTLARFIDGGHFGAHIRAMRTLYAQRRDALAALVRQHLAGSLSPVVPAGGLQMPCLLTREDWPERAAVQAARAAGVELLGLGSLHATGRGQPGFLMGFAAYAPHEMVDALRVLARVWRG